MTFEPRHILLHATVFLTGAAVLVLEVLATRILAPYFGNTIYTVSSILGVVLFALSLGYYLGGKGADRYSSPLPFYAMIAFAGVFTLLIHAFALSLLPALQGSVSIRLGPMLAASGLFFLPAFLLGLLSPWAVKLQSLLRPSEGVGSASGEVFFFSTLGSIAGSFLAGFYLVPHFGVNSILTGLGALLAAIGIAGAAYFGASRKILGIFFLLTALSLLSGTSQEEPRIGLVYAKDGVYERITIFDGYYDARPARFLKQNTNWSAAMYETSDELVFGYTKYIHLAPLFTDVRRALVIGGGAYSIPKALRADHPRSRVDVSEIEPGLPELAKRYFRLKEDPNLTTYIEDGRTFLKRATQPYDLIFGDVYYAPASVPVHFTTKEFFELVREKLSPEGVFMLNFIGSLPSEQPSLLYSEIKTFQAAFSNSYFFALDSANPDVPQNFIFVGQNGEKRIDFQDPTIAASLYTKLGSDIADRVMDLRRIDLSKEILFTDDYAPVEHLTVPIIEKL
jgi:spermidine synthase